MSIFLVTGSLLGTISNVKGQDNAQALAAEDEVLRLLDEAQKLKDKGRYGDALPLVEQALALSRKALGRDHLGTAMSLNRLASLYQAKGEYARAEPLFRESLEVYEKGLGPVDMAVAHSVNNLALLYVDKGEYVRAERMFQRAIEIYEMAW